MASFFMSICTKKAARPKLMPVQTSKGWVELGFSGKPLGRTPLAAPNLPFWNLRKQASYTFVKEDKARSLGTISGKLNKRA